MNDDVRSLGEKETAAIKRQNGAATMSETVEKQLQDYHER